MADEATDKSLEEAAKKSAAVASPMKAFKTKTGPKVAAVGTALKETAPSALSLAAGYLVGLPYKKFKKDMQESALQRLNVGDYSRRAAALAKQAAAPVYEMRAQDRRAEQEGAQPSRMFAQAPGARAPMFDDTQQKVMGQILEQQLVQAGKDRDLDLKTVEGALDDAADKGMITADFVRKLLGRYKAARKEQVEEGFGLQERTADQEEDEKGTAAAAADEKKKQAAEVA